MPDKKENCCGVISYESSKLLNNPCYIDVRSPAEYAADHIPGALNMPLFDDAERERIGTVYRQNSQAEARFIGLDVASSKLPYLLRSLEELRVAGHNLVLYCWRGGMRSQAVLAVAELMRLPCLRLSGGYREYRRYLLARLAEPLPFKPLVLHGLTGCGKTTVLRLLKQRYGLQVMDLEGLANHRGSVFGHIGLSQQPPQKYFQSLLLRELENFDPAQPLIVEGESRRIGRLLLEEPLFAAMRGGIPILLYDTVEGRARRLLAEYEPEGHLEHILEALFAPALSAKFSETRLNELAGQLKAGEYQQVIAYVLEHYYDPLYHYPHKPAPGYALCVDATDSGTAAAQIAEFINRRTNEEY